MVRKIMIVGSIFAIAATTFANNPKNKIGIGAVGITGSSLYKEESSNKIMVLPALDIQYNDLSVKGTNIDYKVYANDMFAMSLFLDPLSGYAVDGKDMISGYDKIEDRESLMAVGTKLNVRVPGGISTGVSVKGGDKGLQSSLSVSKVFRPTQDLTLIPSIKANYFSEDFSEYYFGISEKERDLNSGINSAYTPDGAYSLGVSLTGEYAFNEKISLMVFMGVEQMSEEVKKSPIVENDFVWSSGLGLKYLF